VIIMSKEEFESLQETLELLSMPGFRKDITKSVKQMKQGKTISFAEVFKNKK